MKTRRSFVASQLCSFVLISMLLCVTHLSLATDKGFYLSGGLGAGWSSAAATPFISHFIGSNGTDYLTHGTSSLIDGSGFSALLAMGYSFSYFAVEAAYFDAPDFTENETGIVHTSLVPPPLPSPAPTNFLENSNDTSNLNILSFLAKVIYPISKFHLMAGAGLAIVFKSAEVRHTIITYPGGTKINGRDMPAEYNTFYRPQIVVGIGESLPYHLSIDMIYSRIFEEQNIGVTNAAYNFLPNINFMDLSLSYHFS